MKKFNKGFCCTIVFLVIASCFFVSAYAWGEPVAELNKPVKDISDNILLPIMMGVGILVLSWGIGMLILAQKDDNADQRVRALMMVSLGISLATLSSLVKLFG